MLNVDTRYNLVHHMSVPSPHPLTNDWHHNSECCVPPCFQQKPVAFACAHGPFRHLHQAIIFPTHSSVLLRFLWLSLITLSQIYTAETFRYKFIPLTPMAVTTIVYYCCNYMNEPWPSDTTSHCCPFDQLPIVEFHINPHYSIYDLGEDLRSAQCILYRAWPEDV